MSAQVQNSAEASVKTSSVTKIFDEPYQQYYLRPETSEAGQFIEDCSYNIKLHSLYTIHETCTYNKDMKYVPVIVEALNSVKEYYNNKQFLLQVWDIEGVKVYEHQLNNKVKRWAICYQYLIYKTEGEDENSDCFTIVDLENNIYRKQGQLLIKDFVQDDSYTHMAFINDTFYVANSSELHCVSAKVSQLSKGETKRQEVDAAKDVRVVKVGSNVIHSIDIRDCNLEKKTVQIMVEIEKDHVIIPLEVQMQHLPGGNDWNDNSQEFKYKLVDQREYVPREPNTDWVIQYKRIYQHDFNGKEFCYAVALKQSGCVDIYYDMKLRDTVSEKSVKSIQLTFDSFYLKYGDSTVDEIDLSQKNRAIYRNRNPLQNYEEKYVTFQIIKNHCRLISGYILIETTMFVSHGNLLTLLEIQTQNFRMVKHLSFDSDIQAVYRKYNVHASHSDIGIALQSGEIITVSTMTPKQFDTWLPDTKTRFQLPGGYFLRLGRDYKRYKFPVFLSKDVEGNKAYISTTYDEKLIDLTDQVVNTLSPDDIVIGLYEELQNTNFALYQKDNLTIYSIDYNPETNVAKLNMEYELKLQDDKKGKDMYGGFINADQLTIVSSRNIYKFDLVMSESNDEHVDVVLTNVNWRGLMVTRDMQYIFTLNNRSIEKGSSSGLKFYEFDNIQNVKDPTEYVDRSYHLKNTQVGVQAFIDYSETSDRIVYFQDYENIKVIPNIKNNTLNLMGQEEYDSYIATRVIKDRFIALNKQNILSTWSILTGKKACPDYDVKNKEERQKQGQSLDNADPQQDEGDSLDIIVNTNHNENQQSSTTKLPLLDEKNRGMLRSSTTQLMQKEVTDFSEFELFKLRKEPDFQKEGLYKHTLLISKKPMPGFDEDDFFAKDTIQELMDNHEPFLRSLKKEFRRFLVIEITSSTSIKTHLDFIFPYYCGDEQKLYFNDDYSLMFEQKFGRINILYKKQVSSEGLTTWVQQHRFVDFPKRIGLQRFQDILSPNFKMYVDIDVKYQGFRIRCTEMEQIIYTIPLYLMNFKGHVTLPNGKKKLKTAAWVFNRFKWVSNTSFRLISDDGIESLIDFSSGQFNQIAYRSLQNFDVTTSLDQHAFYYRKPLLKENTQGRLAFKCRQFRSYQLFDRISYPDQNPYETLFTVDYFASNKFKRFIVDLSFSYLNWRLIEKIQDHEVDIDDIDDEIVQLISFTILPGGKQYLHMIKNNTNQLEKFYQRAMTNGGEPDENGKVLKYRIPMFEDFSGKSVFDYHDENKDYIAVNMHLKYLKHYPVDHHSRLLAKIMPQIIENELSNTIDYFESRSVQTFSIVNYKRGTIPEMSTEGVVPALLLEKPENMEKLVQKTKNDRLIELNYIDMPLVHCFKSDICLEYFTNLGNTDQLDIFDSVVVKKQISFVWSELKHYIILKTFIPYIIFLSLYTAYSFHFSIYYVNEESSSTDQLISRIIEIILCVLCVYFVGREIMGGLFNDVGEYLSGIWNYFDLIPPVLIVLDIVTSNTQGLPDDAENLQLYHESQSVIILLMWFKLMYFLRIFPQIGFYVKAIFEILGSIKYFLFVLLFTFAAFGEAGRRLNHVNAEDDKWMLYDNFIGSILQEYLVSLGAFDLEALGDEGVKYLQVIFVISSVINMIIMLNLLIAIVSVEFENIDGVKEAASLREKASLIADNLQLVPGSVIANYCREDHYLLYIQYEMPDKEEKKEGE